MQYLHDWIEFQERYGLKIQRRMEQILAAQGKQDSYTLQDLQAAQGQAFKEVVGGNEQRERGSQKG